MAAMALTDTVSGYVPAASGKGHLVRLAGAVATTAATAVEPDYADVAAFVLARQTRRAMVCLITDVTDEPTARALSAAVGRLRGRHLPVVIAVGDPALDRLARAAADGDAPLAAARFVPDAAQRLRTHRRRALAALTARGAVVVDAPAPRAAQLAVETYVGLKASGRL